MGKWKTPDEFPLRVQIRGKEYVRSVGLPSPGVVAQYRENKPEHSGHLYVTDKGTYRVDHLDRHNPHYSPIKHFMEDVVPVLTKKEAASRQTASSEKALHKKMVESETVREGLKGTAAGTALGAGLRHLGHAGKNAPLYGAALGSAFGAISGYHRGKERALRDTVQQERQHMRTEARTKKAYNETLWAAFSDEVEKSAAGPGVLRGIGQHVIGFANRGAKAFGKAGKGSTYTDLLRQGMEASGGAAKFQRNVGIGATALGAGGLLMAGRAMAPSSPGY